MKVVILVVVLVMLVVGFFGLRSCGAFESGLESEYRELADEKAANADEAKKLYDKAEAFVERVWKFENPPEGLAKKALLLQAQRAGEWAKVATGSELTKALKVLKKIAEPSTTSKPDTGADVVEEKKERPPANESVETEKKTSPTTAESVEAEQRRRNSDPTSDTIPAGREELK